MSKPRAGARGRVESGRGEQVGAVEGAGGEALLPEMAAAAVAAVEPLRILAVGLTQGAGEGVGPLGDGDEVDVVRHEAIAE